MYDLVENKFYSNNGTGNFIAGNELLPLNNLKWIEGNQSIEHVNENILPILNINQDWQYEENYIKNINRNAGVRLTAFKVNAGQVVNVNFVLLEKPTVDTSFSSSNNSWSFTGIQNFEIGKVYTRTINVSEDMEIRYSMWGNSNSDTIKFQMWANIENIQNYKEHQSKTINLTDLPPSYSENDYIYYDESLDKYFVHNEWDKYILTGNEQFHSINVNEEMFKFEIRNAMENHELLNIQSLVCNFAITSNVVANGNIRFGTNENANTIVYYCNKDILPTIDDFRSLVRQKYNENNPLYIIYGLETPIDEEIIDKVLIEQLDELRKAFTYEGTNHFIVTSENGQSANLKVEVYKDTIKIMQKEIDNLKALVLENTVS